MELVSIALSARARLPHALLEHYLPASPVIVGKALAEAVQDYVDAHDLGYYPALDYFHTHGKIDKELLDAVEHIAWRANSLVHDEVRTRLSGVFARVQFGSLQSVVFTLPPVRPGNAGTHGALLQHFTPDTVMLDLRLGLFQRGAVREGLDALARIMVIRCLKPAFADLSITAAHTL